MVKDTLRFCNLIARLLYQFPDGVLRKIPEHFLNNVCDILMGVAKMKPKLLRGMELRFVFSLVVKLLSPTYASVSTCIYLLLLFVKRNKLTQYYYHHIIIYLDGPKLQSARHVGRRLVRTLPTFLGR
jgi:hypothetical protein